MTKELTQSTTELSTDLSTITAEINAYQRIAGEAIFEIGRRLKHVKENDLAHGEWARWCEGEVGIDRSTANKFIRVFEELSEDVGTYPRLGLRALYEIATLPPEHREVPHELPSGETKKPEDMTVRELRELKRRLKAEQAERERLEKEVEELSEREPEVRVEYERIEVETIPDDYEEAKRRLEEYKEKFGDISNYDEHVTATHRQDMLVAVMSFSQGVREFIKRYDYMTKYKSIIDNLDESSRNQYNEAVKALKDMAEGFEYTSGSADIVIDASFSEIN